MNDVGRRKAPHIICLYACVNFRGQVCLQGTAIDARKSAQKIAVIRKACLKQNIQLRCRLIAHELNCMPKPNVRQIFTKSHAEGILYKVG